MSSLFKVALKKISTSGWFYCEKHLFLFYFNFHKVRICFILQKIFLNFLGFFCVCVGGYHAFVDLALTFQIVAYCPPTTSLCSLLALMPLWLCDWELSITCWWTGSVLTKVHVGQKEMAGVWQAGSMEGGKAISHRLVGPLLLVKPEPPCYCPGCVRDIPRALFWL